MLAAGDAVALVSAYALSFVVSEAIGPLPAVSAPPGLLAALAAAAVPVWLAIFTGYKLYENDSLRISVASFDEVRDVFHAMIAG